METFPKILLSIYGVAGLAVLVILVYLVIRRLENKKKEDFEKRDN